MTAASHGEEHLLIVETVWDLLGGKSGHIGDGGLKYNVFPFPAPVVSRKAVGARDNGIVVKQKADTRHLPTR